MEAMSVHEYHRYPCSMHEMIDKGLDVITCNRWHSKNFSYHRRGIVLRKPNDVFLIMHIERYGRPDDEKNHDMSMTIYKVQLMGVNKVRILNYYVWAEDVLRIDTEKEDIFQGLQVDTTHARRFDPCNFTMTDLDHEFMEVRLAFSKTFCNDDNN